LAKKVGTSQTFDYIEVHNVDEEDFVAGQVVLRYLNLKNTKNGEIQSLVMYEYSDWPDHSVPGNVETLIRLIQSVQKSHSSKMVVHSSTGVGRTGTFFALHKLMQLVDANVVGLDIFQTVLGLRRQRKFMVKQLQQYQFLYSAVEVYIKDFSQSQKPSKMQIRFSKDSKSSSTASHPV